MKARPNLKGCRLLIVEDDFIIATEMGQILESLGCTIVGTAGTAAAATSLLRATAIDGAVLDMNVAGEWSTPLLESLLTNRIPLIVVTAYGRQDLPPGLDERVLRLTKPVPPDVLKSAAMAVFGGKRGPRRPAGS